MFRSINWKWLILSLLLWYVISYFVGTLLAWAFPGLPSIVAYLAVLVVTFVIVNYLMQRHAGRIHNMRFRFGGAVARRARKARRRGSANLRSVNARVETQRVKRTTDIDAELRKLLDDQQGK